MLCAMLRALLLLLSACAGLPAQRPVDVCVYGATSAGVTAAVQACRQGNSVVLLDCDGWVGGLTSAGLGATDVGNEKAIGGLSREFYRAVRRHYANDPAWTQEARAAFKGHGHDPKLDAAFTFEPHVASAIFAAMLKEAKVEVVTARLDRTPGGVVKQGARIVAVKSDDGRSFAARVFLDCSYEGDLLAAAGCRFVVGREANAAYGETLNGVQVMNATKHQFTGKVDPYVVVGDKASGLLPGIEADGPGVEGSADHKVQAYCFRVCATDVASNQIPWPKPDGYDARDYELLLRHFEAGSTMAPWHPLFMPNRKTDANNNGAVSFDWIGQNWDYPEASYAERAKLLLAHRRYQQGLLWTLSHSERVPTKVQEQFQRFGLCRDEFTATGGWSPLLYIREARRLVGELVVTEHDCKGERVATDPVGLGAYGMDSHNVQRYVAADGRVRNEGDVQVRVPRPYGISYRALCPQRAECDNLLVPVCLSASHIAYGSIRMEPVFMVLGQSAAIAAGLAVAQDIAVQDLDHGALRQRLLAAGQVLAPVGK